MTSRTPASPPACSDFPLSLYYLRAHRSRLRSSGLAVVTVASLALLTAGCNTMSEREQGTARGAAAGALAGAVLSGVTSGSVGQGAVLGGAVGAVAGNLWSKRMEDKREALSQASANTGVSVVRTPDNRLRVVVPGDFSFDPGRADIQPRMRPLLEEVARNLTPGMQIAVIGHTDGSGSDDVNEPLSRDRAEAVRSYLAVRGVDAARVSVQGRGAREPIATNSTEAGRAANRRVEIYLHELPA